MLVCFGCLKVLSIVDPLICIETMGDIHSHAWVSLH